MPLLILACVLSLDNFRVSIALGGFRLKWRRALRTALVFGLWDGLSPLIGALVGRYLENVIGPVADTVGPIALAAYGLYLVAWSLKIQAPEEPDDRWVLFGMPLSLSLDNMVAGASLGLLGFPPLFSATVFGVITALMSFIGLQLGRVVARFIPIRSDLLTGIGLLIVAAMLALGR
ncbi:MAG TPA: manganese efflux pump [Ktedonobacterales bacterium]|nr:manganese efflux pump [Ktedonobacterales bacterium]